MYKHLKKRFKRRRGKLDEPTKAKAIRSKVETYERKEYKSDAHLCEKPCKRCEEFFEFVRKKLAVVIPRVVVLQLRYFAKSSTMLFRDSSMARDL